MEQIRQFGQYGFVIRQLVSREIKRKYTRSYLGIFWSVLNPLMSMAVISMVFSKMFHRVENYSLYLLTGNIIWQLFTGATNAAMGSLVDNKTLLIRVKFPKIIFPLSRVGAAFVNFFYTFIAYLFMLLVFRISPSATMLLFPIIAVLLFLFSAGISYLLSIVYVFFGDIKHLYSVLLTLWMYCSAIFYPIDSTPELVQKVIAKNPIYNYIASARNCMLYHTLPSSEEWMRMILWGIGSYLVGRLLFAKFQNRIMQEL